MDRHSNRTLYDAALTFAQEEAEKRKERGLPTSVEALRDGVYRNLAILFSPVIDRGIFDGSQPMMVTGGGK